MLWLTWGVYLFGALVGTGYGLIFIIGMSLNIRDAVRGKALAVKATR
jgi:hypothetical protein